MMNIDQIIKELMEKLIELPDLTGMARCAGFYMLYQGIQMLKQQIDAERQKNKEEILTLQAEIHDLKGQLYGRSEENGPEHE